MASTSHQRRDARLLGIHAAAVGLGWFVVALAGLVGLQTSTRLHEALAASPPWLGGTIATLLTLAAFPLAWPAFLALGWYEGGLAQRLNRGDGAVRRSAVRILRVQAVVLLIVAALALAFWSTLQDANGGSHLALAWLPPTGIAVVDLVVGRRLRPD